MGTGNPRGRRPGRPPLLAWGAGMVTVLPPPCSFCCCVSTTEGIFLSRGRKINTDYISVSPLSVQSSSLTLSICSVPSGCEPHLISRRKGSAWDSAQGSRLGCLQVLRALEEQGWGRVWGCRGGTVSDAKGLESLRGWPELLLNGLVTCGSYTTCPAPE